MQSTEQYISKGYYSHSQIEGFISVKNYIFASRQRQNYLLLRFENLADFTANSLEFTLIQLDRTGTVLETSRHSYDNLTFCPGSTFTPSAGIPVHKYCTDFQVRFSAVTSGRFTYRVRDNLVNVFYTPVNSNDPAVLKQERNVWYPSAKVLTHGKQGLAVLCGICALLVLFGLSALQMYLRYQDAVEAHDQTTASWQTRQSACSLSSPFEE